MKDLTFEQTQVMQSEQRVARALKHDLIVEINELHLLILGVSMSAEDAEELYKLDLAKLDMMLAVNSQQLKKVY